MAQFLLRVERVGSFLGSKRLALWLIPLFCISVVPGTFSESDIRLSLWSGIILGCLGLNLTLCTLQRFGTVQKPILVLHIGMIVVLCGAVITSFGYVATVNIYEGTGVDTVYRWDLGQDVSPGVTVSVNRIDIEYYPIPLQIGVLRGKEKSGPYLVRTGQSFEVGQYAVRADSFDAFRGSAKLSVFQDGRFIGTADTEGFRQLPDEYPYDFRLVAFQKPAYKKVRADIGLQNGSGIVARGYAEPNSPLAWNGLRFYLTNVERDEYGNWYAGLQVVRDPGRPVVYLGFAIVVLGSLMWLFRRVRGRRNGGYPVAT